MYLYYDLQGRLKEIVDDFPLRQYGNQANKIYAYFESEGAISSAWYSITKNTSPTPTTITREATLETKEVPFSDTRDLKYFEYGKTYNFYVYTLTSEDLEADGWLKISPLIYFINNGNPSVYGEYIANVSSANVLPTEDISLGQYEYLLSLLGQGGGGSVVVDDELSYESTNPVENRVITTALNDRVEIMRLNPNKTMYDLYLEIKENHNGLELPIVYETPQGYVDKSHYLLAIKVVGNGWYMFKIANLCFEERYYGGNVPLATMQTLTLYEILNSDTYREDYATKSELASKQDTLVSGTTIKTINNQSLLGSGNIDIGGGGATITIDNEMSLSSENPVQNKVITQALGDKQDNLVSGTNIKTINSQSLLGSGDITISGGSSLPTFDFTATNLIGTFDTLGNYSSNLNDFLTDENCSAICQNQNPHTKIILKIGGTNITFFASKVLVASQVVYNTRNEVKYYAFYNDIMYELVAVKPIQAEDVPPTAAICSLTLKRNYATPYVVDCGTVTFTDGEATATISDADATAFLQRDFAKNIIIAFKVSNTEYFATVDYGVYTGGTSPSIYYYVAHDADGARYVCTFVSGPPHKINIDHIDRLGLYTIDKSSVNFALADFNTGGLYVGSALADFSFTRVELAALTPRDDSEVIIFQVDSTSLTFLPERVKDGLNTSAGTMTYTCTYGEYKYIFTITKASGQVSSPSLYSYSMSRKPASGIYKHRVKLATRDGQGAADEITILEIYVRGEVDFRTTPLAEFKNGGMTTYPYLRVVDVTLTEPNYDVNLWFDYEVYGGDSRILTYETYVDKTGTPRAYLIDEAGYESTRLKVIAYSDTVII